jgi:glycosyltransferase involved in cell wall biosynthesis
MQYSPSRLPKVSIGMPAYNSAAWIEKSIESLLAQSFGDFELVISDNASTDRTYAICEAFARLDPRIRLLRNPENLGANRNYLATLAAARGVYFKWASSNDVCGVAFLEKCVAALDGNPAAVLVCPRTSLFEDALDFAQPYAQDLELNEEEPAVRFISLFNKMALNNAMNGLIRKDALVRVSVMGSHMGADIALMAELALMGKFLLLDDRLFYRRMSEETATKLKSTREAEQHLVPTASGLLKWQHWLFHWALLRAARSTPFLSRDWFRVCHYGLRAIVWSRSKLAQDLWYAIRHAAT